MKGIPVKQSLLSELQGQLSADLFASATSVRRAADDVLFVAGDAGNGCYRVEDGLVKVTMMSRAGVERILAFLGPGAIVGELAIIDGRPRSASVVAVRETRLKFLSRATFEEFAGEHPEVYKNLVKVLATRLRITDETVAAGSFLSLKGRVARTLLELAEEFRVSRLACGRRAVSTERSKLSFPQCSIKNTFALRLAAHCWPSCVTQR
jgi:CRP/FNR family transcriptional regulator, cyclic AMP receptor protein